MPLLNGYEVVHNVTLYAVLPAVVMYFSQVAKTASDFFFHFSVCFSLAVIQMHYWHIQKASTKTKQ